MQEYEDQLDGKDLKIADMEQQIGNLKFHLAELDNLNDQLQDVIEQNHEYAIMTEKSVQEAEYWKRTALRKDIEIQSMKINKNLDFEGHEDDRSSQKSNLASSSQPKNEHFKQFGGGNSEMKNKDYMMLDLQKVQSEIEQDQQIENNQELPKLEDKDLSDLRERSRIEKSPHEHSHLFDQLQTTVDALAFNEETPGREIDVIDFNKVGEENKELPSYDFNMSRGLQDPVIGGDHNINSEFRETEEYADNFSNLA